MFFILDLSCFQLCFGAVLYVRLSKKAVEGHCLQTMEIGHHHASGRFDWLISELQSVNLSRKAIFLLSWKYKRFTSYV